jgi:hypothetical protein
MKTKKNELTNFLKLGILLIGISLLLWNCEKENLLEPFAVENVKSPYKIRSLRLEEIPRVENYFRKNFNKSVFGKTDDINGAIFDVDNILETIDTIQNTNYSFRFVFPLTPSGEFYNLIIGKTPEGELTTPLVLKFICEESQIEIFEQENYKMNFFKGKISVHKYTDFFALGSFSNRDPQCPPELDANGNIVPCDSGDVNLTGGSYGDATESGGVITWDSVGSGDPEGSGDSGSGYSCHLEVDVIPCDNGDMYNHGPEAYYIGGSCTGGGAVINLECGTSSPRPSLGKTDDCIDCIDPEGAIGINSVEVTIAISNKIKSDNLDPCSNEILTDLKTLGQNDIAKVLQRFDSPNSFYYWEVKTGTPTNANNVAETNWAVDFNNNTIDNSYLTIIKPSYTNQATKIAIARTILHESIHAYIISYIDDLAGGNTQGFSTEFPDLWNNFVSKKYGVPANNIEDYQHQEMAENFINIIRDALAEYDNNQLDGTYYEHLAWGALMNTDAFERAIAPGGYMNQSEQEAIVIANNQEDTNGPLAKGTPCN